MKYVMNIFVIIFFVTSGSCIWAMYDQSEDNAVVNDIVKESNITEKDYNKWRFSWLGPLQNVAAMGAGGYAMYQAGQVGFQVPETEFFKKSSTFLQQYGPTVSENIQSGLSNKWLWALAGAAGAGFATYKILYPRLERGILNQVEQYVKMCEQFQICIRSNINLDELGTAKGDSIWAASDIARKKGVDNLLYQNKWALKFLDLLTNNFNEWVLKSVDLSTNRFKIENLRIRVKNIKLNLESNSEKIKNAAKAELKEREQEEEQEIALGQKHANLNLAKEKASALKVGKISLAMTAVGNFFQKSMESLVYLNDNKEKIIAGAAVAGLTVYGMYSYIKSKLGFGQ